MFSNLRKLPLLSQVNWSRFCIQNICVRRRWNIDRSSHDHSYHLKSIEPQEGSQVYFHELLISILIFCVRHLLLQNFHIISSVCSSFFFLVNHKNVWLICGWWCERSMQWTSGAAGYRSQPVNHSASIIYPFVHNPFSSFVGGGDQTSTLYPPPSVVWWSVATDARLPAVSSPDAWIEDLNRHQYWLASGFRGYSRLPKLQLPMLTRDPLQWPRFIQAFGFQVDRTCNDDAERVAFLSSCLCEEIRKELGSMLLNLSSYQ